jgi:hypothetical protein
MPDGKDIPATVISATTDLSKSTVNSTRYDTKLWMRDLMEGAAYLPK